MEKPTNKVDQDLLAFITESRELLEEIEPKLIAMGERLERHVTPDRETVNFLFRGFHTIKGTAAFYQLDDVVSVAHKAETLLEYFRNGEDKINVSCTDVLCQACDVIEFLFRGIESMNPDEHEIQQVRSIITRLTGRIDSFRKKHEDQGVRFPEPNHQEMAWTNPVRKAPETITEPLPGKTGRNVRIFVSECLAIRRDIQELNGLPSWTSADIQKCLDSIQIMLDGALFLGFEHMANQLESLCGLLENVKQENKSPQEDACRSFERAMERFSVILDHIEQLGTDDLSHEIRPFDGAYDDWPPDCETDAKIELHPEPDEKQPDLKALYYLETEQCLENLAQTLGRLQNDRSNRDYQQSMIQDFHMIKGSSGLMNQADMERVTAKAEDCLRQLLKDNRDLDDWDINALVNLVEQMSEAISQMKQGRSGLAFQQAALIHILDYISKGLPPEQKAHEISFNDADQKVHRDVPGTNSPMPHNIDEKAESDGLTFTMSGQPVPGSDGHDEEPQKEDPAGKGLLWGGERRRSERRDIRVNIEKLDELINLVGELVVAENMVVNNMDVYGRGFENFEKAGAHLRKIVRDLQDVALAVRMVPISGIFRKMIRLVHDLSRKFEKKIQLKIIGEDTEIDKTVSELIADPLVHLVRNAIDHGILKKNPSDPAAVDGRIVLEARHEGGEILVIVKDDGKGLDRERIYEKAFSEGLVSGRLESLSDQDIYRLIFTPGFSTHGTVTDISGRGVGMDVVKRNMDHIKGQIHVYSKPGKGTTFVLSIPLTLAILEGMLVRVGMTSYTIPLMSIRETVIVDMQNTTETMDGQEVVNLRGVLIPVIRLDRIYGNEWGPINLDQKLMVVIEHQSDVAGILIDEILGEQQTVIKGMSGYMKHVMGISGCTILSDGEVSLILDVGGLINRSQLISETRDSMVV